MLHRTLRPRTFTQGLVALSALSALTALAACGTEATPSAATPDRAAAAESKTLVVATHDSWAMSKKVMAEFTARTGITVKVQPQGDAGELTNKLVLTKGRPLADGVYGIDNAFATRAVDEGVLTKTGEVGEPPSARPFDLPGAAGDQLSPVDYSDVCVNVDDAWFAAKGIARPRTLDDLTDPVYKGLFVTPGATTSSPGLAFLLATIAAKGDGWHDYWKKLVANDVKVVSGWSDAYEVDFTGGGGKGDRPIVTSYSSSPPFTIPKGASKPTTSALLGTCFRQVEYAGVLAGAKNPTGMAKFIAFMHGREFQAALPDQMYVYPVDSAVTLPADWARYATPSPTPYAVDPAQVTAKRETWLREWRDLTSR